MPEHDEQTTAALLPLRILTPQRMVFEEEIESLETETVGGKIEVYPGHEPLLTPLAVGLLLVRTKGGGVESFAIHGGFLEVHESGAVILADSSENAEEIDPERAQAAKVRAQERLDAVSGKAEDVQIDIERAHAALMRAITRLRVREESPVSR